MRIKIAQCTWPILLVGAAIWSLILGAQPTLVLLAYFISVLPFLAWLTMTLAGAPIKQSGANLIAILWIVVSFASIALSGGILSPLTVFLALGPASLLSLGRPREALESAALGTVGYFSAILVGFAGWAESAPESWTLMRLPWASLALLQLAVFVWACRPELDTAEQPRSSESDALTALSNWSLPMLLVEASDLGRIRRILGPRNELWPELKIGQPVDHLLPGDGSNLIVTPNGVSFRISERLLDDRKRWIALLQVDGANEDGLNSDNETIRQELNAVKEALAERTAFFAGLGHDLKTPLNAILGFADLMKAEVRGPMPEAYKDYPAIIHESGQDLMLLVEDILDLAKSEANSHRLELEPVDLVSSAASVVRQLEDQAARAGVKLVQTGDPEAWAEADPRAVRQIWQNLVSNAVKYSADGDDVTLSAGRLADTVFLSVMDKGAGMSQEDLDRVATPFAQGANSKGRAGTGLGLAVVQRFAELHGGRVIIDTAPGKGTRVRVTLPAASSDAVSPFEDAAQ
ncbi:MAG: ATP-binding protein [Pseudomonadota bacterium]